MTDAITTARGMLDTSDLVWAVQPEKPARVVLSVPHDGLRRYQVEGFFTPRTKGVMRPDTRVWPIVRDIMALAPVSVVRGLVPRAYIDYNRAWPEPGAYGCDSSDTALDDLRAVPSYTRYHDHIHTSLVRAACAGFGRGGTLLLDMHGFKIQPSYAPPGGYDIILGTGHRATIPFGNPDVRLAEHLEQRGYRVFLPREEGVGRREGVYAAGYTTRRHASILVMNAIQIEIARKYREVDAVEIGQKLARDLADFVNGYEGFPG